MSAIYQRAAGQPSVTIERLSVVLVAALVAVAALGGAAAVAPGHAAQADGANASGGNETRNVTDASNLTVRDLEFSNVTLRNVSANRLVVNVTADGEARNVVLENATARRVTIENATVPNTTFENATLNQSLLVALIGEPGRGELQDFPRPPEGKVVEDATVDGVVVETLVVSNSSVDGLTIEEERDSVPRSATPDVTAERVGLLNATASNVTISGWSGSETGE